ncbi:MAG: GNAT family N-acetyltransferase [Bacteroidia bacterium]|nr:GNAT family N-acetyltransferase [Bacteroidia bacterium]
MNIRIVHFSPEHKDDFYNLNAEWLNKYYFVTNEDEVLLRNPERIIENGGMVYFALLNEEVVGTCAIIPEENNSFELIKMGVSPKAQNKGIGSLLMTACVNFVKQQNANQITLETAVPLKAAIHLYEKFGFIRTSDEYTHPVFKRVTFKMKLNLSINY